MRIIRFLCVGVLAALVASVVVAQSVSVTATVSWTAPVNDANGFPLAGSPNAVTSYNVYASAVPLTAVPAGAPLATAVSAPTTVTGAVAAKVGDTLYMYVTACNQFGCSELSNPGTKLITAPAAAPGTPTSVTITVVITPAH